MRVITTAVATVLLLAGTAFAAELLTNDEVAVYKKKLVAVQAALGKPPAGYAKDNDEFNLAKEITPAKSKELYYLAVSEVRTRYSGEKLRKAAEAELEKKIAAAEAKGDYEAMNKQLANLQTDGAEEKEPINVTITLNSSESRDIDRDTVVVEKPGVIGIIIDPLEEVRTNLMIFFDPVRLKDTKTLTRISVAPSAGGMEEGAVAGKTVVRNIVITLTGPLEEVKVWAKNVDVAAVLKQIDRK